MWRSSRETGKLRVTSIALLQALRCQGLSSSWMLLPPTVIPAAIQVNGAPAGTPERVVIIEESFSGQLPPPDLPPPKKAA